MRKINWLNLLLAIGVVVEGLAVFGVALILLALASNI